MTQDSGAVPVTEAGDGYDEFCRVALSLFRFIGAAYATGASDCSEAAYRFAGEAPDIADSPLLVARAAALRVGSCAADGRASCASCRRPAGACRRTRPS